MLDAINDFDDYMENADVEEIAKEHGITLSPTNFKEFCKSIGFSGYGGRHLNDSDFYCYDGQIIKHNLLDYYSYFTKTINNLFKLNMNNLDYELASRQISDLIEVSKRIWSNLYDVKDALKLEIDKK